MCPARFPEHFDAKQLDVVVVAIVETTSVAAVASVLVVCELQLADAPDISELRVQVGEC